MCYERAQKLKLWHEVRSYRFTTTLFRAILCRWPDTPPNSFVLKILQPKQFISTVTEWEIEQESVAIQQYLRHQHSQGHPNLTVAPCGFLSVSPIHTLTPFQMEQCMTLHDQVHHLAFLRFGVLTCIRSSQQEACSNSCFCCSVEGNIDGNQQLVLHTNLPFKHIEPPRTTSSQR